MDQVGAPSPGTHGIAKPLVRFDAPRDGGGVVNPTVPTRVGGKGGFVVMVDVTIIGQDRLFVERSPGGVLSGIIGAHYEQDRGGKSET